VQRGVATVTDITAIEIPKPLNWQDFQRKCVILFRCVLGDERLQEWGSEGQTQHGIDLFGYRGGLPGGPVGVQCRRLDGQLSAAQMRADAAAARAIEPPLTELIFATTTKRDIRIQQEASKLTQELHRSGWPCRVTVMAWQDLHLEIVRHPDALRAFWPQGAAAVEPLGDLIRQGTQTVVSKIDVQTGLLSDLRDELARSRNSTPIVHDPDLPPEAQSEPPHLHARISAFRELLRHGKTRTAIRELANLLQQTTPLPPYARYRIVSNIGSAHFSAGRVDDAREQWTQALALRPDDPKAQTNLAFAELACGDRAAAGRRAEAVLAAHPDHAAAAAVLIHARSSDPSVTDPLSLLPPGCARTPDVLCAAVAFLRARDDPVWHTLAAEAHAANPDHEVLDQFAAEAVLQPVLADVSIMLGKPAGAEVFATVRRCAERLEALWRRHIDAEEATAEALAPLAHNTAAALRFTGQTDAAARLLDRTLERVGRDPALIRARALLHLHADEDDKAAALLATVNADPELQLLAAEITAETDPTGAAERLKAIAVDRLPSELQTSAAELQVNLAIHFKDAPAFTHAIQRLADRGGRPSTLALLRARAAKAGLLPDTSPLPAEQADDDTGLLDAAAVEQQAPHLLPLITHVQAAGEAFSFPERIHVAQFLGQNGAPEIASGLLHDRVTLGRDTVGLRTYLTATVAAHLTARAEKALSALPPEVAGLPFYKRTAATLYWNIGDARRAAPLIAELSRHAPQRLDLLLWHIDALHRLDDQKTLRRLLQPAVEHTATGTFAEQTRLVTALNTYAQPERALKFAYELLCRNRDEPRAWMCFMGAMAAGGKPGGKDPLLSETVTDAHVVTVSDPENGIITYRIEADETLRRYDPQAISPTHPIAVAVRGLKPGDAFSWPGRNAEGRIQSAKHKYLDAFHAALERFNDRFPDARGFLRVRVRFDTADGLDDIKAIVKARADHIRDQSAKYAAGHLSLPMLAHLTGADPIETMLGLTEIKVPYRVAIGLQEERRRATDAIRANQRRGCVVDIATLHCIRHLNLEDAVRAVCGPMAVTQATLDLHQARCAELVQSGDRRTGSMAYRDGRLAFQETTPEAVARARQVRTDDLAWIRNSIEILPAQPAADPREPFRMLGALQGARFCDDIFAASGSGRVLLADDLFTRQMAAHLGVASVWLQPVLMAARGRGLIGARDYAKAVADLVDIGQNHICIDTETLISACEIDRINSDTPAPGRAFRLVCSVLGGRTAEPNSHCNVAAGFINHLWSEGPRPADGSILTSHVLRSVLAYRHDDYREMLTAIFLQVQSSFARRYMRDWAAGHFLRWP